MFCVENQNELQHELQHCRVLMLLETSAFQIESFSVALQVQTSAKSQARLSFLQVKGVSNVQFAV